MGQGLRKNDIKRIITQKINKNPDIYYFINNDYIEELINLIIEGVVEAIDENNKNLNNSFKL